MTTFTKSIALAAVALGIAFALPASAQEAIPKEKTSNFSSGVGSNAPDKAEDKGLLRSVIDNARERGDLRREQRRETVDTILDNAKERQNARKDNREERKENRAERKEDRKEDRKEARADRKEKRAERKEDRIKGRIARLNNKLN